LQSRLHLGEARRRDIPAVVVAANVAAIIFCARVLFVAVTAAVSAVVAFGPAAGLPSLSDAEQARATAKCQQPCDECGMYWRGRVGLPPLTTWRSSSMLSPTRLKAWGMGGLR